MNKNTHILPTNKPSRLCFRNYYFINKDNLTTYSNVDFKNIYITSDEEIKEGDWVVVIYDNKEKPYIIIKCGKHISGNYKKIILTTDQELINDGIQAIDDKFLEWFVKNPSCESVEIEKGYRGYNLINYKIIIPKEEPKQIKCYCGHTITCDCEPLQETIEEVADRLFNNFQKENPIIPTEDIRPFKLGFIKGTKWQQERMYSEEDMINFAHFYFKEEFNSTMQTNKSTKELLSEWFEQNKNK
jgi:hypothetical protein